MDKKISNSKTIELEMQDGSTIEFIDSDCPELTSWTKDYIYGDA